MLFLFLLKKVQEQILMGKNEKSYLISKLPKGLEIGMVFMPIV